MPPPPALRSRARSLAARMVPPPSHQWLDNSLETKHFLMAQTYGAHLPMSIRMELDTVCQSKRLPGMPTSNLAAETILGRDETIDFEDYLGMPQDSPDAAVDMRALLEKKYGLLPRNSLVGRIGGPQQAAEPPRANVAMAKPLGDL